MSHKLDDVLEAVLESYVQHPHIGKIGETQFPKRHLILAVLKKLQYMSSFRASSTRRSFGPWSTRASRRF